VVEPLGERVLGRVVARDVLSPASGEVIVPAGTLIDEHWVEVIERNNIDEIEVRSPITCDTRHGICAKCYGRDLARGHLANIGRAVHRRAGNPAHHAYLPHRWCGQPNFGNR